VGDKLTRKPFLVVNGNAHTFHDFLSFQEYLDCKKRNGFDSCNCEFGETYKYEKRGKFVYAYLSVFVYEIDSPYYKSDKVIMQHLHNIDSVWKKIYSFIPNDTIFTPSDIFRYEYMKTVYTGRDTTYKINNKKYTCGIFYNLRSNVDTLYIEKKNGVIFSRRHITQIRNSIDKYPLQKGEYFRGDILVEERYFKDTNRALRMINKLFKQEITDIKRIK